MKQAWHIFKKDARHLRLEIAFMALLAAAFTWFETHSPDPSWIEILLAIAGAYLTARLVQAEALIGVNQFGITRPYCWKSLLAAKCLFIIAFIHLPVLAARFAILIVAKLPLIPSLPGLLWSQLLMLIAVSLPLAALAAVTASLVPFIFALLFLLGCGFVVQEATVPPSIPAVRTLLSSVQWVWDSIAIISLVLAAVPVLYWQYKGRRTLLSRAFAFAVVTVGALAYLYVPWPFALDIETRMPHEVLDTSSVRIALDPGAKRFFGMGRLPGIQLDFPIAITGIPAGLEIQPDALSVSVESAGGETWKSGSYDLPALVRHPAHGGAVTFNAVVVMNSAFFTGQRNRSATLRGSLYLTFFGKGRSNAIALRNTPVQAFDNLQCFTNPFSRLFGKQLFCRSPFRWPAQLVYAKFGDTEPQPFRELPPYSPFPAGLSFTAAEVRQVSAPKSADSATIIAKDVLKHGRFDFEIPNLRLSDFAGAKEPL